MIWEFQIISFGVTLQKSQQKLFFYLFQKKKKNQQESLINNTLMTLHFGTNYAIIKCIYIFVSLMLKQFLSR